MMLGLGGFVTGTVNKEKARFGVELCF